MSVLDAVFLLQFDDDAKTGLVGPLADLRVDVIFKQDHTATIQVTRGTDRMQVDMPIARLMEKLFTARSH